MEFSKLTADGVFQERGFISYILGDICLDT